MDFRVRRNSKNYVYGQVMSNYSAKRKRRICKFTFEKQSISDLSVLEGVKKSF